APGRGGPAEDPPGRSSPPFDRSAGADGTAPAGTASGGGGRRTADYRLTNIEKPRGNALSKAAIGCRTGRAPVLNPTARQARSPLRVVLSEHAPFLPRKLTHGRRRLVEM